MFDRTFNQLEDALNKDNKALLGFGWASNIWKMFVLDLEKAGRLPILEESRDKQDWKLELSAREKRGTIIFAVGESFDEMLLKAFNLLKI